MKLQSPNTQSQRTDSKRYLDTKIKQEKQNANSYQQRHDGKIKTEIPSPTSLLHEKFQNPQKHQNQSHPHTLRIIPFDAPANREMLKPITDNSREQT